MSPNTTPQLLQHTLPVDERRILLLVNLSARLLPGVSVVQKDYILRMIEAIGLMVARIRSMISRDEFSDVHKELAEAASRTGIELEIGKTLDGQSLLNIFMPPGATVDPTNSILYGEVLYLDGLACAARGEFESAHESFAKALLLLRSATGYASSIGITYPDTETRINELLNLLEGEAV